jgi:hypothetical protein
MIEKGGIGEREFALRILSLEKRSQFHEFEKNLHHVDIDRQGNGVDFMGRFFRKGLGQVVDADGPVFFIQLEKKSG